MEGFTISACLRCDIPTCNGEVLEGHNSEVWYVFLNYFFNNKFLIHFQKGTQSFSKLYIYI